VSNTEIQATEITSQETNGDLSGWGDQSTNDWSTPVDNTWGTPADNGWGDPAQSSWNAHPSEQPKSSINNLRSKPASTSREGSVSTSTSNKAQGNKRGSRGKARRVDSGSVTTESTPLSPRSLAPAQMTPRIESVPLQPQLSPQVQPTDQSSSYNESNATDEMVRLIFTFHLIIS
jgi:hypothetical protein